MLTCQPSLFFIVSLPAELSLSEADSTAGHPVKYRLHKGRSATPPHNYELTWKAGTGEAKYLHEMEVGSSNDDMHYPLVSTCVTVTIKLSNNVLLGVHMTLGPEFRGEDSC